MKFYKKYLNYLIKDIRLNFNYKYAFVFQFISPIFYLAIFYNISLFVSESNQMAPKDYFLYASIGICLIDILSIIVISQSKEIVNLKVSGVIEEIVFIDKNVTTTLIAMSSYSVFVSLVKVIFYFFMISIIMGYSVIPFENLFLSLITIFILIISFVFLALICGAFSLYFSRVGFLPMMFIIVSVFFGKAYFPSNFLPYGLEHISIFFSFSYGIENIRALSNFEVDHTGIIFNIATIIFLSLCYFITGWLSIKAVMIKVKRAGNLENF